MGRFVYMMNVSLDLRIEQGPMSKEEARASLRSWAAEQGI